MARIKRERPGIDPARQAALALIDTVLIEGKVLDEASVTADDPAARARAMRLAAGTLRKLQLVDKILGRFLDRLPPMRVRNVLRLATLEMLDDGAAAHGVVHSAVSLVRARGKTAQFAGLTNAVLRKVNDVSLDAWQTLPPQRLPTPLRRPLVTAFGKRAVTGMEAVFASDPPVDLTVHAGAAEVLAEKVGGRVLPGGSVRLDRPGRISALPGYEDGAFWVQDAAAALPVRLLGDLAGLSAVDLCAAPGGKTLQLAAAGAEVTAVDLSETRLERLRDNLKRTRLSASVVAADAAEWQPTARVDLVLLDAPCSATGTIRRHPDLPHLKSSWDRAPLLALQTRLLTNAARMVKPGGRLLYCTCSLLPEEGEAQVAAFLQKEDGFAVEPLTEPSDFPVMRVSNGLRTRPDQWADLGGIDGFFITLLRKSPDVSKLS